MPRIRVKKMMSAQRSESVTPTLIAGGGFGALATNFEPSPSYGGLTKVTS
jgi:hypothetical protein